MPHSVSDWDAQWQTFLRSVGNLIEAKISIAAAKRPISPMATRVIADLSGGGTLVGHAMQLFDDPYHPDLEATLYDELTTISQANQTAAASRNSGAIEKALEDSETGKKSIEDLIGFMLPDWLKKALKLLNQLIKILRG
jgi:hypothetical protein